MNVASSAGKRGRRVKPIAAMGHLANTASSPTSKACIVDTPRRDAPMSGIDTDLLVMAKALYSYTCAFWKAATTWSTARTIAPHIEKTRYCSPDFEKCSTQ